MKEAIVYPDTSVKIEEADVPQPKAGEVLVKVVVAGVSTDTQNTIAK
jgi:NADPH:quinone reductase-like Zn-dependent oxidoreductase